MHLQRLPNFQNPYQCDKLVLEPAALPHPSEGCCSKSFRGSDLCEMGTVSSNRDKCWLQWAWRKTVLPNSWSVLQNFENLVFLTVGKEMFWFLTKRSLYIRGLCRQCSNREHRPFSHQSSCAAYSCNSRQQRWDSRLLWGVLSSHPQRLNMQFSADMIFPTSTPVLGTDPGKLKTLPHDTHSALQYLFPNPSDKCSCYSVLILSQTHQHALKMKQQRRTQTKHLPASNFPIKSRKICPNPNPTEHHSSCLLLNSSDHARIFIECYTQQSDMKHFMQ